MCSSCLVRSLLIGIFLPWGSSLAAASRPNVVMIMTDNHGAWTLGCYGNPDIRTPCIDRLAAEGTLFDAAFASNPVCSPTRASTLTGLIPSQHGVHCFLRRSPLQMGPQARNTLDEVTSLPELLKVAGYRCGLVGKWHLGANLRPQEGFDDYWVTMPHGGTSTFYDAKVIQDGVERTEPEYLTDFWTRHAVKFLHQQANDGEAPFFLFLSYNGPYSLSRLLLREGRNRHVDFYRGKGLSSFPRESPHPWQLHNRDYQNNPVSLQRVATEVSGVDDGVGTVMDTLKALGLDDNTLVVFLADQGWVGGHGGFFGMGDHTQPKTARDGMMQIPLIWRHPHRITPGRRSQKLVANYDILPTLVDLLELPSPWEDKASPHPVSPGRSFATELLLTGAALQSPRELANHESGAPTDDAVFYEFETLRCIRTQRWKYVHRFPNGPQELYDLANDPMEFVNLHIDESASGKSREGSELLATQAKLKTRLHAFFDKHAVAKYDLYNGGRSQTVIYDGIDEEEAQRPPIKPPPLPIDFVSHQLSLPDGFSAELVAGPPLVTHPTMGCFDDRGRLYVCDGAGINMTAEELEEQLPHKIRMLEDQDGDGVFDKSTDFADGMTFPMGGTWHAGSLYVASPPNIWRLTDMDNDGVADRREIVVDRFGYTGNAASIHGCFMGPTGRIYWCDGYHGHSIAHPTGEFVSERKGSYIFSCWPDGSDIRIHCGGGMDNPVEVDFTAAGDMIGTVNILYTRPRIDCLVHWQYGGAYPHREAFLEEWPITGDLLEPIHRFGHVAVSGTTRYRSGVMNHNWGDDFFVTQFNLGKVVRIKLQPNGSTYETVEREFASCENRNFHPTDVIEDADGSLLVVDTGGWFYRGCPTSQLSRPEVRGGIYRIQRNGMTTVPDARGLRTDWTARSNQELTRDLKDTRFAVQERIIAECVRRGNVIVDSLTKTIRSADIVARRNALWATAQIFHNTASESARQSLLTATGDRDAGIRQSAWHALAATRAIRGEDLHRIIGKPAPPAPSFAHSVLVGDSSAAVRREMHTAISVADLSPQAASDVAKLYDRHIDRLKHSGADRQERHALVYTLMELSRISGVMEHGGASAQLIERIDGNSELMIALDQMQPHGLPIEVLTFYLTTAQGSLLRTASQLTNRRLKHADVTEAERQAIAVVISRRLVSVLHDDGSADRDCLLSLVPVLQQSDTLETALATVLTNRQLPAAVRCEVLAAITASDSFTFGTELHNAIVLCLSSDDVNVTKAAIHATTAAGVVEFAGHLAQIADEPNESAEIRMACLSALGTDRATAASHNVVSRLIEIVRSGHPAETPVATYALSTTSVSDTELLRVAPLLESASPQSLRDLLRLFNRRLTEATATVFVKHLDNARSLASLPALEVSEVVKRFPPSLHDRSNRILDRLQQAEQSRSRKLDALIELLPSGNAVRGRRLFFDQKSKCATCHRVGDEGKRVGPDLTTIGANRTSVDLLESILFPSATIVRQYEPYTVVTTAGLAYSGVVLSETADGIVIQQSNGDVVRVASTAVDEVLPVTVSIMPGGLDEILTNTEVVDLVAWLQSLTAADADSTP